MASATTNLNRNLSSKIITNFRMKIGQEKNKLKRHSLLSVKGRKVANKMIKIKKMQVQQSIPKTTTQHLTKIIMRVILKIQAKIFQ